MGKLNRCKNVQGNALGNDRVYLRGFNNRSDCLHELGKGMPEGKASCSNKLIVKITAFSTGLKSESLLRRLFRESLS